MAGFGFKITKMLHVSEHIVVLFPVHLSIPTKTLWIMSGYANGVGE